ncbi:MAG: integrase core domain-containing protein [Methylocystis sp.]
MESSKTTNKFSPEVRERAVRMVRDHQREYSSQWAAISSIASKIGCTAQTLSNWVRQAERDAGVEPSVGSVGDSYDNALAETVNGLYKAEVIWRRGPWRSLEQVEFDTLEWVDWFNNRRLLEPIGNIPPAEAEARYYAQIEEPAMAA